MIKGKFLLFGLLFLLLVTGCQYRDGKGKVPAASLISRISLEESGDNILRVNALIELKTEATVELYYYPADQPENGITAKISPVSKRHVVTMLLLEPETEYAFTVTVSSANSWTRSEAYRFTTGPLPFWLPQYELKTDKLDKKPEGYIHIAQKEGAGYLVLLNYKGKIVWYQKLGIGINVSSFDPKTGTFACIVGNNPDRIYAGSEIILVDLYGNILMRRQNTSFDNPYFHHDIRLLGNGNLLVVNCVSRVFDLRPVGGKENQTVWGDGYTMYGPKGEVVKTWDVFNEISPLDDKNILGIGINEANYPVVYDWVHANTITVDTDGNYLMCFKQLNQVWKIDSQTGRVFYRLGLNGNLAMDSTCLTQGVHSVNRDLDGNLLFFDNGLFRGESRALSFQVDTVKHAARLVREIVLPKKYFSRAQGSVYMIDQDHYLFGASFPQSIVITDRRGDILWDLAASHVFYRAYPIPPFKLNP